jgi:hypothetical protein
VLLITTHIGGLQFADVFILFFVITQIKDRFESGCCAVLLADSVDSKQFELIFFALIPYGKFLAFLSEIDRPVLQKRYLYPE